MTPSDENADEVADEVANATAAAPTPRLSIVLVCQRGWDDLRMPLPGLQGQTIADSIELVLVARPGAFAPPDLDAIGGLHSVRLAEVESPLPRGVAAAAGVAIATAPFIGLHENHTRAEPQAYEAILDAMPSGVGAVAPTFYCPNADRPWAAAVFVLAHGHSAAPVDAGPRQDLIHHHAVYPAAFLRRHADEVADEIGLQGRVLREGGELRFHPDAVLWHIESADARMALWIATIVGRQFGWSRSRGWSTPKRLARSLLLPAIVAVSVLRLLRDLRRLQETRPYFWRASPHLAGMGALFALGEVRGYFDRADPWPEAVEAHEFECVERLAGHPPRLQFMAEMMSAWPGAGAGSPPPLRDASRRGGP